MIVFSVVFDIIELFPSFRPDTALELLLCSVISVLVIVIFWLDFPVSPPWTTVFVVILEDVSNGIWAIPLDDFDSFAAAMNALYKMSISDNFDDMGDIAGSI